MTFTPLGFGTTQELPATPADLFYFRLALDPGVSFPVTADDPSVALAYVESGTFTVRVEAPMQVLRAATVASFAIPGAEEGGPPALEQIAAGTEFAMGAGDSAVFPPAPRASCGTMGKSRPFLLRPAWGRLREGLRRRCPEHRGRSHTQKHVTEGARASVPVQDATLAP